MSELPTQTPRPTLVVLMGLFLLLLLLIMGLAYTNNLPPMLTAQDKLGHLFLYGMATYLGQRVFARRHLVLGRWRLPLFFTLFSLFTIVEEGLQGLSPHRALDGLDLMASLVGIAIGYGLARWETRHAR